MSDTTNPLDAAALVPTPPPGVVDPAAIARGHEVDAYDNKSVLSVPLLVIVFFALAFTSVTIIFSFVSKSVDDPNANLQAVEENNASINERLAKINRNSGGPKDQPRLEPLRMREGDARVITQPETKTGNSPEIHPEDIRPNKTNTPELYEGGPVADDKTAARISIDDAMRLSIRTKLFPTSPKGTEPPKPTNVPTAANGGRGAAESVAVPPKLPDAAGGKQ